MKTTGLGTTGIVRRWGVVPAALMLLVFLILPIGSLVLAATQGHGAAFVDVFRDPLVLLALGQSLLLATAAGTVSVAVGLPLAACLASMSVNRRRLLMAVLGVPLAFSGLVVAYGFILSFGRAGFVTSLLAMAGADPARVGAWIYSAAGLVVAYAYYLIPRVALLLYPTVANLDRRPLDAAMTLGAPPWRALLDVVLRELWPSILGAWCLVTSIAVGTYGTALALAGTQITILPLLMYMKLSDGQTDFSQVAALSLVLMAVCMCVLAIGESVARRPHA
ncbi:ABC transporter permease [Robbsia andropogonis]|uniref:ABC transporter permease n=1 Tax=Robbsia andropogonis TaxID=28092 RepID=A0A0F5K1V8_9BURK|nr:ABC transporter permease subunit [Robbsia andropogonis]KKB63920.1 ABC transporter permease [Robbsia andropogonis]